MIPLAILALHITFIAPPVLCQARDVLEHPLTFNEMKSCQRAIQDVYRKYEILSSPLSNPTSDKRTSADTVSRLVLAHFDRLSRLREIGREITREMLLAELRRVQRSSRFPERLLEVFASLNYDDRLIAECFIRPLLVERLLNGQSPDMSSTDVSSISSVHSGSLAHQWRSTSISGAPTGRYGHSSVWTGAVLIVWGGTRLSRTSTGGRYDPMTDTWLPTSLVGAPDPREFHTAVWTGEEMIVWGGADPDIPYNTGGRYDPVLDTWRPTSSAHTLGPRHNHIAVWTGTEMIVWGGAEVGFQVVLFNDGARYDPVADAWTPMSMTNAPTARYDHTAVWTGTSLIIWGGNSFFTALNTGAKYTPATNSWSPVSINGNPTARIYHTAVWTGSEMVIWGGCITESCPEGVLDTGGRYNPLSDEWGVTSLENVPAARGSHTAISTGRHMVVWGGADDTGTSAAALQTGGIYEYATDRWSTLTTSDAPSARPRHTSVWTGREMLVWGGYVAPFDWPVVGGRLALGPSEVLHLQWMDTQTLSWAPDPVLGVTYDLVYGKMSQPFSLEDQACMMIRHEQSFVADRSDVPQIGRAYYYLVRGRNDIGLGSYGHAANGENIAATACDDDSSGPAPGPRPVLQGQ